jgi:hypothetical protein
VRRRKAAGPATDKVNGPHAVSQAGKPRDREATPSDSAFQGLAVYDGTDLAGFIVERTGGRFVAFDLHDRLLGSFPTLRAAVRSIPVVRA